MILTQEATALLRTTILLFFAKIHHDGGRCWTKKECDDFVFLGLERIGWDAVRVGDDFFYRSLRVRRVRIATIIWISRRLRRSSDGFDPFDSRNHQDLTQFCWKASTRLGVFRVSCDFLIFSSDESRLDFDSCEGREWQAGLRWSCQLQESIAIEDFGVLVWGGFNLGIHDYQLLRYRKRYSLSLD